MAAPPLMLATQPGELFANILPWLIAIVGLAVLGAIAIMLVRRGLRSGSAEDVPGFSLQSLRDLRDRGEISDEEFERAREAMIGRVKANAARAADNSTQPSHQFDPMQAANGNDSTSAGESSANPDSANDQGEKPTS